MKAYKSYGKLLLTAEYVVLDGALALAVPTKYGQDLHIETLESPEIIWTSLDHEKQCWFTTSFKVLDIKNQSLNTITPTDASQRLLQILVAAHTLNPSFLNNNNGFKIITALDFPRNWGLGTSSTLINNIAHWANVNPYKLLELTFGGSGYDIACAQNSKPITYQITNNKTAPIVKPVNFNPKFKDALYFVYLNKKQNSREGIANYRALNLQNKTATINKINTISLQLINCNTVDAFNSLIEQHEELIANITKQSTVKALLFPDFNGAIKSLGAWGGDFILVSSKTNPTAYFNSKGYQTMIPYEDMVL